MSDSKRPNVSFRPPTEQERAGAKVAATVESERFTATEDALRRAVDTTPAFIHTARPDGHLDYFNRGWLDFLGKSLEDVCGWRWTESVDPEDVAALVQKWHAAKARRSSLRCRIITSRCCEIQKEACSKNQQACEKTNGPQKQDVKDDQP